MVNIEEINPNEWYKPRQIAEFGWVKTPSTKEISAIYNYVLKLIKNGKLRAINYAEGEKGLNYYKVLGKDIIDFINRELAER